MVINDSYLLQKMKKVLLSIVIVLILCSFEFSLIYGLIFSISILFTLLFYWVIKIKKINNYSIKNKAYRYLSFIIVTTVLFFFISVLIYSKKEQYSLSLFSITTFIIDCAWIFAFYILNLKLYELCETGNETGTGDGSMSQNEKP